MGGWMSPPALLIADSLRKCVTFGSSGKWDATHCVGEGSDHIFSMHHSAAAPPGWCSASSWAKEASSGLDRFCTKKRNRTLKKCNLSDKIGRFFKAVSIHF